MECAETSAWSEQHTLELYVSNAAGELEFEFVTERLATCILRVTGTFSGVHTFCIGECLCEVRERPKVTGETCGT